MSQTINITDDRVQAAINLFQTYGAGLAIRNIANVTYPNGSYTNDQLIFTKKDGETFACQTNLAVIAPGVTLNLLSEAGFIFPPLNGVDTAMIYPGVNDFNVVANTAPVTPPPPVNTNFIGPEMIPGSGRHYALSSPLDHFPNGGICYNNGKWYVKIIVQTPFGNSVEWDEMTIVGN